MLNYRLVLLLLAILCGVIHQSVGAKDDCKSAFTDAMKCFSTSRRVPPLETRNDQRKLQMMTQILDGCYRTANSAVGGQNWQTCKLPPFDLKAVAIKQCLTELKPQLISSVEKCMKGEGEPGFKIPQAKAPRASRRRQKTPVILKGFGLQDFNAKTAAFNCEESLGISNLAHEINLCYNREVEKQTKRFPKTPAKGPLLALFTFDKECKDTNTCKEKLNIPTKRGGGTCESSICNCYEQARTSAELQSAMKDCVLEKHSWIQLNAEDQILALTRDEFPFCTPPSEDDICDPQKGVYSDVANTLQDSYGADNQIVKGLRQLADGAGANAVTELFGKVFNINPSDALSGFQKLLGNLSGKK